MNTKIKVADAMHVYSEFFVVILGEIMVSEGACSIEVNWLQLLVA